MESKSYFKLIDQYETSLKLSVLRTVKNSKSTYQKYGTITLVPGEKYELGTDEVFIQSLKSAKIEKAYSTALEDLLKANGIKYTTRACKSCGGRVKKISYCPIEIVEV